MAPTNHDVCVSQIVEEIGGNGSAHVLEDLCWRSFLPSASLQYRMMSSTDAAEEPLKKRPALLKLVKDAAAVLVAQEDVWAKHDIPSIPAERVIRHMYNPSSQTWYTDETIVKMQKEPFTHGAMRHCYRMKKLSTPPGGGNHRFHWYGWSRASNYVAKCYMKDDRTIDTSDEAKEAVRNDILLQYEAAHWAEEFDKVDPPHKIIFIRAYAIEFPDRPGKPLFAVERFITGKDSYGGGFMKHNTNSGFVDLKEHRITPQVFSAHSFYASNGTRLVTDIQGVGDMFTDPQVLSMDYRFGEGDLGPRGMALFFKSFRHCGFSDRMGIPIFHLSRNELKHQAKYDEDEITVSDEDGSLEAALCKFGVMDLNRQKRRSLLLVPPKLVGQGADETDTERRSNLSQREDVSQLIRTNMSSVTRSQRPKPPHRSVSDVDEVSMCLTLATTDTVFDYREFHRKASGEIRERHSHNGEGQNRLVRGSFMKKVAPVMVPNKEAQANIGKVHYHLACLHGMGRFPEIVPLHPTDNIADSPPHDVFSVLFHLCHACSLHNVPACLSLARLKAGLDTTVSDLLQTIVPVDFEGSKDLLRRAMESPQPPAGPKAAAGCLLYQILHDEGTASSITIMHVIEDTLALMAKSDEESKEAKQHKEWLARGGGFHPGDKVEANFAQEGTYYPGVIVEVSDDGTTVVVQYDDDNSTESLTVDNVRANAALTALFTDSKCPGLSDNEALGGENSDEKCIVESYVLKAELAEFKAKAGDTDTASVLLQEAADGAMNDGKMQTATKWSELAYELVGHTGRAFPALPPQ